MTTRTALVAAALAGRKDRPPVVGVFQEDTPPQTLAFLIETGGLDSAHRSSRPKTFSASTAVLDFAQQFCSEEYFSATTADRWNFGLCATIPREPRQARKGATVTGQLRVPRNTRSSSLAPGLLRMAAPGLLLQARENGVSTTLKIDLPPMRRNRGSQVTNHESSIDEL
jgi:hypothetical protein